MSKTQVLIPDHDFSKANQCIYYKGTSHIREFALKTKYSFARSEWFMFLWFKIRWEKGGHFFDSFIRVTERSVPLWNRKQNNGCQPVLVLKTASCVGIICTCLGSALTTTRDCPSQKMLSDMKLSLVLILKTINDRVKWLWGCLMLF